jgi:hypothetical protein
MRSVLAVMALGLAAACATDPGQPRAATTAQDTSTDGTWTFEVDPGPGVSSASLRAAGNGPLLFAMSCDAQGGLVEIRDWTFARSRQGPTPATLTIGATQKEVDARVLGTGDGRQALALEMRASDPFWAALTMNAPVQIAIGQTRHRLAEGAASRFNDVLLACRATGS